MEIRKDFYPSQLAEILCTDAGRTDDKSMSDAEAVFYDLMAICENEHNRDAFRTAWEMMQEAAERRARQRLQEKELDYLSRGLIALIRDAGRAKELCMDRDAQKAIDRYTRELQQLNTKICTMEAGEG